MELKVYLTLVAAGLVVLAYLIFVLRKLVLWSMTRPNLCLRILSILNLVGSSILAILIAIYYDVPMSHGTALFVVPFYFPLIALTLWLVASFGYYLRKQRAKVRLPIGTVILTCVSILMSTLCIVLSTMIFGW